MGMKTVYLISCVAEEHASERAAEDLNHALPKSRGPLVHPKHVAVAGDSGDGETVVCGPILLGNGDFASGAKANSNCLPIVGARACLSGRQAWIIT